LGCEELVETGAGKDQDLIECGRQERMTFGRALDFDKGVGIGHDHVEVHIGAGVLAVIEIEHRHALDHSGADRRHLAAERVLAESLLLDQPADREGQGDIGAGDRRAPGATVRAEHIAIEDDLTLAQPIEVDNRPQ
jgi:hypothetical protein